MVLISIIGSPLDETGKSCRPVCSLRMRTHHLAQSRCLRVFVRKMNGVVD